VCDSASTSAASADVFSAPCSGSAALQVAVAVVEMTVAEEQYNYISDSGSSSIVSQ
jgi:hypothetical protein